MASEYRPLTPEEERKLKEKLDLKISIDSKQMEELVRQNESLKSKASGFDAMVKELTEKLRAKGVDIDSSQITDVDELKTNIELLNDLNKKEERTSGSGASGTIPLRGHDSTTMGHSEGYENIESLIDDLRAKADPNSSEKREAEAILNELWRKTIQGLKSPEFRGIDYDPNKEKSTESEVDKMLEPQRRRLRRQRSVS